MSDGRDKADGHRESRAGKPNPGEPTRREDRRAPLVPTSLERIRVRRMTDGDLPTVAPMLALASAAGLAAPAPPPSPPADARDGSDRGATKDHDGAADPEEIEHDEYWLAVHDRDVVGFVLLHHLDRNRAAIRTLWIDARHRRQGVGTRLLEGVVQHCHRAGYLKVVLELPFSLERMLPLFGRLGFAFARSRSVSGNTLLEFYLDLYREPG